MCQETGGLIRGWFTMHTQVEPKDPNAPPPLVAAIEAGGTKFVCAIGNGPGTGLRVRQQFPTGDDAEAGLEAFAVAPQPPRTQRLSQREHQATTKGGPRTR